MDMYEVLAAVQADDQPSVLATIVCVEGHSYRKAGSAMLIRLNGEGVGTVSPGCLEQDLLEQSKSVWDSGGFKCVDYNMNPEEDVIWGEAVGCGGKIMLLLEAVGGALRSMLLTMYKRNQEGFSVRLERVWSGKVDSICYELHDVQANLSTVRFVGGSDDLLNRMSIVSIPRPRLVLFGVGKDVEAIYSLVKRLGFHVVVTDWRPSLCSKEYFPEAECVTGTPGEIVNQLKMHSNDYLIICSHNLHQDKEMLRLSLPLQLVYIGIMGSKKRIRMLFETFLIPSNVRAPIGLPIHADGPVEIAISVAAELIAIRSGRKTTAEREMIQDASFGSLFSGRTEQKNGSVQASAGVGKESAARKNGIACALASPPS